MKSGPERNDADYRELLRALVLVAEESKGTPGADGRLVEAEGLCLKCFFHSASVLYLSRSTTLTEMQVSFFDSASINVLARAAFETFLIFHYVFVRPKTDDEKDFRYMSWVLSDLLQRQTYPVEFPESQQRLESEKECIDLLIAKIHANKSFLALTPKQQQQLLKKKLWRFHSWTDIALSAGISHKHAESFYHHLCSYAHAGNLSVLQLTQARTAEAQRGLHSGTLGLLKITMANMVKAYCEVFPKSEAVLEDNPTFQETVRRWLYIGANA